MLKFKVDENLPTEAAELLVVAGYDAVTVSDQRMAGQPDENLGGVCQSEGRAVVALDLDFADIRAYPPSGYAGIIVLRLARLDKPRVLSVLQRLLPVLGSEPLVGKLWIVEEASVRIRG
jgi:predicted nuclease of predicted toxin-antitoxin system